MRIGTLDFEVQIKDGQFDATLDEMVSRIKELSTSAVQGGEEMDNAINMTTEAYKENISSLEQMRRTNEGVINAMKAKMGELLNAMNEAEAKGDNKGLMQLEEEYNRLDGLIRQREVLQSKMKEQIKLQNQEVEGINKAGKGTKKQKENVLSMRREMRKVIEEMRHMDSIGEANTERYRELEREAGRLYDIISDTNAQRNFFAHDNQGIQTMISGVQGLAGAFSVAQGAIGIFSTESENLEKVMLRVQSAMSMTMGLQQLMDTLNKDSAFSLGALGKLKEWWAKVEKKAGIATAAETVATEASTVATEKNAVVTKVSTLSKIKNTIATKAQMIANLGLVGTIKLIGTAIKSIPIIGQIIAVIAAVGTAIGLLTKNVREERKEQKEMNKAIADTAAEPVAALGMLSESYKALGDNMEAKNSFIKDHQDEFKKLGVNVTNVAEAENLLIENKDEFVRAQLLKAKSIVYGDKAKEAVQDIIKAEQDLEEFDGPKAKEDLQEAQDKFNMMTEMANNSTKEAEEIMRKAGLNISKDVSEMVQKTADASTDAVFTINKLSSAWKKLGDDMNAKKAFISNNKKEFDSLGESVNTVTDAENLLVKNKDAFVEAQKEKAKALAAMDIAKEKYKELLQAQLELEEMEKKPNIQLDATDPNEGIDTWNKSVTNKTNQIDKLQKEINNLLENYASDSINTTKEVVNKDMSSYHDMLQKKKQEYKEYNEWIKSNDPTIRNEAKNVFADLLQGGDSYIKFLQNEKDALVSAGKGVDDYQTKLRALNEEIVSIANENQISVFKSSIEAEMDKAQSLGEMLDYLIEKRKEVEENTDDDLKDEKEDIVNDKIDETNKKLDSQLKDQLNKYSQYWEKRLDFEANYATNKRVLEAEIAEAEKEQSDLSVYSTNEEIEKVNARINSAKNALSKLKKEHEHYMSDPKGYKGEFTDAPDYSTLLKDYQSYVGQKEQIEKEFNEKIRVAQEHGDLELVKNITDAKKAALSELASNAFFNSDDFVNLFDNLDEMTVKEIEKALEQVHATLRLYPEIDESTMERIKKELKNAEKAIADKNPFKALGQAVRDFKSESDSESLNAVMDAGVRLAGNFSQITNSMREIAKLTNNELLAESADFIDDVFGNLQAAEEGAKAWGGWWGAIIGGVIDLIPKVIKWVRRWDKDTKAINEKMAISNEEVAKLKDQYEELSEAVSRQVGSAVYETNRQLVANLKLQKAQLEYQLALLESAEGKDRDEEAIKRVKDALKGVNSEINNTIDTIVNSVLGSSIGDMAKKLGDSLVTAFSRGTNAARSFRDSVKDIMKDIVRNMVVQNILVDPINAAIAKYTKHWADESYSYEKQMDDLQLMYAELMALAPELEGMLEGLPDVIKDFIGANVDDTNTLSGALAKASQESIDVLAGGVNATRVNVSNIERIVRDQLAQMYEINNKIAVTNTILNKIEKKFHVPSGNDYRANGIKKLSL